MNEKKNWIHTSLKQVVKCIGSKAQDNKCVESLQEKTMGIAHIYVAHINMFSGSKQLILALLHVQ